MSFPESAPGEQAWPWVDAGAGNAVAFLHYCELYGSAGLFFDKRRVPADVRTASAGLERMENTLNTVQDAPKYLETPLTKTSCASGFDPTRRFVC